MDSDGFRKLYEEKKGCALTEEDNQLLSNLSMKEDNSQMKGLECLAAETDAATVAQSSKVAKWQSATVETGIESIVVLTEGTNAIVHNSDILDIDDNTDSADRRTTREQRKEEYFREQREQERLIQEEVERRLQEEIQRRLETEVARQLQTNAADVDDATHTNEKEELQQKVEQQLQSEVKERATIIEDCQKQDLSSEEQKHPETPQNADSSAATQSAKKRRLPLHETPNAKRKRSSPTMAESVLKYQKRTPPRFRSTPCTQSVGPARVTMELVHPQPAEPRLLQAAPKLAAAACVKPSTVPKPSLAGKLATSKHTQPKPFNFCTDQRASQRLSMMGPPAPQLPQVKRPSLSLVSRPSLSTAPIPKPTVPQPFRLSISNRSSSLAILPKPEPAAPFRATPLNRKMFTTVGEVGVPRVIKRESTVPQDFGFMKRELEKQKLKKEMPFDGKENLATPNVPVPGSGNAPSLKRPRAVDAMAKAMLPPPPKRTRICSAAAPKTQTT